MSESINSSYLINENNCIMGYEDHLYKRLKVAIERHDKIDIIVSFLMESGVRMLVEDFRDAINRGASVRILCGNYLNITQPQALYLLKMELGDTVDLRFYSDMKRSFHPKAYIFENLTNGEIFIGSSNISKSALTNGIEWNYRIEKNKNLLDFEHFKNEFQELFINKSIIIDDGVLKQYSKSWKKPKTDFFQETFEQEDEDTLRDGLGEAIEDNLEATSMVAHAEADNWRIQDQKEREENLRQLFTPRGAQIEALYELKKARLEGWEKGIIVAATGIGKTYLAAFDSREFNKILFVAHREEILYQAERSFKNIRPQLSTGFFTGNQKDVSQDIIFATVQTLGKDKQLGEGLFSPKHFSYIVIDEFHHAIAGNYKNILDYFKPEFMLGLTATPERMDNEDVFALCDYNLIYEVRLKEAINKGWLAPFRYYGIYDSTDYENIAFKNGKYDAKDLEKSLIKDDRARLILDNYRKYDSDCGLGFCANMRHAVFMAKFFSENGIKAKAVISDSSAVHDDELRFIIERKTGILSLRTGDTKIIFSVDMFNEGLDVPEVDMVMFLRPTESPTIFLQQLGRGLRKHGKKKYVNVLDFIGNYKKANLIPFMLISSDSKATQNNAGRKRILPNEEDFPEGCMIDFDFRIIDLFKKMDSDKKIYFNDIVDEEYRISEGLGHKALRLEMYTYMNKEMINNALTKKDLNIFRDFLGHLDLIGEIDEDEKALLGTVAHEFLKEIEKTAMTRLYKMPILLGFYNNGEIKMEIDDYDIARNFRSYYSNHANALDLLDQESTKDFMEWDLKKYVSLARRNPMKFLAESAPQFFSQKEGKFCLSNELAPYIKNPAFVRHFKDIIDYKTRRFVRERLENENNI